MAKESYFVQLYNNANAIIQLDRLLYIDILINIVIYSSQFNFTQFFFLWMLFCTSIGTTSWIFNSPYFQLRQKKKETKWRDGKWSRDQFEIVNLSNFKNASFNSFLVSHPSIGSTVSRNHRIRKNELLTCVVNLLGTTNLTFYGNNGQYYRSNTNRKPIDGRFFLCTREKFPFTMTIRWGD